MSGQSEVTQYATSADGTKLAVRVSGTRDGMPLLLLHGVSSSSVTYDWLPQDALEGLRVYKLDFRGHGASDPAPGTYTHLRYFDDAVAVLEQLIKQPAALSGFSLGGMVGWTLAQRRPELLLAGLLEEPVLFPEDPETSMLPEILRNTIRQEMDWKSRGIDDATAAAELGQNPAGPDVVLADMVHEDSIIGLAAATRRRDRGVTEAAIAGQMTEDIDITSPLKAPVVVLAGGKHLGSVFHPEHADILKQTYPDLNIRFVNEAGHDLHNSFAGRQLYTEVLAEVIALARGQ